MDAPRNCGGAVSSEAWPVSGELLYTRFKRSFRGQVMEYAGTWDLPTQREVLALPGGQNFQQYVHIDRSLKPLVMRPSLVLVQKALDRMWFRALVLASGT
jgi:hypothetical protein